MIFKNFEYFLAIAETGSVSKAAEQLYISQPSLSKYLKRLEMNLEVELFNRDSYPLRLSPAGELYLSHVKEILQKEKNLMQDFSDLKNQSRGTVSLGITVWRSSIILPIVLPKFRQLYPGIEVKVYEGSHQYMASLLEHDKVDFSIFHLPNSFQNITFEHLQYEKLLFCVSSTHPLLRRLTLKATPGFSLSSPKSVSAVEGAGTGNSLSRDEFLLFQKEPFILLKPGQNIRDLTQNFLNKMNFSPNIALETSNIVTATNATKAGLGVTFVPEAVLRIPEQAEGLTFFTVDSPPLQWEVGFAYKAGEVLGRHARLLIECIQDTM